MNNRHIRMRIFVFVMACILLGFVVRLLYMQFYRHGFYLEKSRDQVKRIINLYPHRGYIYDRNKVPLAITITSYSAYAIPQEIEDKYRFSNHLAAVLQVPPDRINKLVHLNWPFVWLKRKLDVNAKLQLDALKLKGLYFIEEEKRIFPQQELAADALGFVGIDNQGLSGIEYKFDRMLKGSPGKLILEGDPHGYRLVTGIQKEILPYDGGHIITTLDEYVQYITQKYLAQGVAENEADAGFAIVMDPKTGDVLAMADVPAFNPNTWNKYPASCHKNSCITDVFEPGSIFKIFTVSAVLEENLFTPDSVLMVPESLTIANRVIREAHEREHGDTDRRTVSEIIEKSLNCGTSLLAMQLGEKKFYDYMQRFGFGKPTGIELPGESPGLLRHVKSWSSVDIAMMSFGQGIAVTPIQIAAAAAVIANKGTVIKPRIVKYIIENQDYTLHSVPIQNRQRIMSAQRALDVIDILTRAVDQGTGVTAQIPGYKIAGKTGTAQKPRKDGFGYEPGKYMASFVGFFPAYDPKVLILVVIDSPRKSIYGSSVAAPVFKNISERMIDYMDIAPTEPITPQSGI